MSNVSNLVRNNTLNTKAYEIENKITRILNYYS